MLEYTYSYIQFEQNQLSMTIIDETLCTLWQGFDYDRYVSLVLIE